MEASGREGPISRGRLETVRQSGLCSPLKLWTWLFETLAIKSPVPVPVQSSNLVVDTGSKG